MGHYQCSECVMKNKLWKNFVQITQSRVNCKTYAVHSIKGSYFGLMVFRFLWNIFIRCNLWHYFGQISLFENDMNLWGYSFLSQRCIWMEIMKTGNLIGNALKILSCIVFMYTFSMSLTFYNKWIMKVCNQPLQRMKSLIIYMPWWWLNICLCVKSYMVDFIQFIWYRNFIFLWRCPWFITVLCSWLSH